MEVNKTDIIKFLTKIRVNFENAYKCNTKEENILLVESWYDILHKYPKEVCEIAVNEALEHATQGRAPRIGDIVSRIKNIQNAYDKEDTELWAELTINFHEVRQCAYSFRFTFVDGKDGLTQGERASLRVKEIFNNLDPLLKEYCRNSSGLVELAQYTDEQLSFERGRFMKVMPTIKARLKTRQELPESVRTLIQGMVERTALPFDDKNAPKGRI